MSIQREREVEVAIDRPSPEQAKAETLKAIDRLRAEIEAGRAKSVALVWLMGDFTAPATSFIFGTNYEVIRAIRELAAEGLRCDCAEDEPQCHTAIFRDYLTHLCGTALQNKVQQEKAKQGTMTQ